MTSTDKNLGARLMSASEAGDAATVKLLLAEGASANYRTGTGETPLIKAAAQGDVAVMRLLLDHGAAVDGLSGAGSTPLMFAAHRGQGEAVALLLEAGANKSIRNQKEMTAMDYARANGHLDALNVLTSNPEQVSFVHKIGSRLMEEVFDFTLRERVTLLRASAEGPVETMLRDPFIRLEDTSNLRRAFNIHRQRGGKVPEDEIFPRELSKRRLPAFGGQKR